MIHCYHSDQENLQHPQVHLLLLVLWDLYHQVPPVLLGFLEVLDLPLLRLVHPFLLHLMDLVLHPLQFLLCHHALLVIPCHPSHREDLVHQADQFVQMLQGPLCPLTVLVVLVDHHCHLVQVHQEIQ